MIKGIQQVAAYNSSATRLFYTVVDHLGRQQKPDAAPTIAIYSPGGTALVAATNMTIHSSTTDGYLAYDAQTAEFVVGETLTGGTSSATALIVGQSKTGTTGVLQLADIGGTFQNNETITDSGSGSATSNGTLYQSEYYYDLNTSSTTNYGTGKNYYGLISYAISSRSFKDYLYFDVAVYPATGPWVTSADVSARYPSLTGAEPTEWVDWAPAIQTAHAKLVRQLHSLGSQAAHFVKRREEMWDLEMIYTRAEIARATGEPLAQIKYWDEQAANAWTARGEFTFDSDDDADVDDDVKIISSGFSR